MHLRFARSDDGGDNWAVQKDADANDQRGPYTSLAVDGAAIYISYLDWSPAGQNLVFAKSVDNGNSWATELIDTFGDVGFFTSIDVEGSYVYISYSDYGSKDLKFVRSQDGGTTWPDEPIEPLLFDNSQGWYTHVQAAGDNVYILHYNDTGEGTLELAKSIDSGESW